MPPLSASYHHQVESHIRIEKALDAVRTATTANLTTTTTVLTNTTTLLENTTTLLTTTNTLLTDAELGASLLCDWMCRVFSLYLEEKLERLRPVSSARFDSRESPGGCLENTREDVLNVMRSWLSEPSPPSSPMSIFWLAGLAGTGKSTVIKTFCQRVSSDNDFLLASFFASRNSAERRDPYRMLHTFAHQLAISSDRIRPHVLSAMRAPQDVMQELMLEQIKQLLAGPIEKAQLGGRTIVFAIDALDECQKNADGVEGGPLIELLAQALQNQPVKLLVTSRQEDNIANMFHTLSHVPLRLHEIASAIVESDIRRVFNAGFAEIRRKRARDLGTDLWPTQSQLDTLVHFTGPFFIYATTVLKFIDGPRFLPKARLNQILERGSAISTDSSTPFLKIDALYADVLKSATEEVPGYADKELCRRVGNLLRTVVLLEEPVSIRALAHLMGILEFDGIQQIDNDVRALGSVLWISDSSASITEGFSETVSTFHPSFRDFLVDPQRCSDEKFLVEPAEHQHKLLYRCLQLLNRNLCTDFCGIRHPGVANAALQDLRERLTQSVPEAVRYASQFWQIHLVASGPLSDAVFAALLELCTDHALHWLEVISLLGELSSVGKYLARSIAWCQVSISSVMWRFLIGPIRVI
jgi:hypothetical protein